MCKTCVIFVCVSFLFVSSEDNGTIYTGLLTPECAKNYFRVFVSRRVPPRNYQYHHETLLHDQSNEANANRQQVSRHEELGVELGWRIVGGKVVPIVEVPYQVLYGPYCGGALIAPEWVITAAHCKTKETHVLAGNSRRSRTTKYRICAHFVHPLWNKTSNHPHDYDYQLVLLERPIPVTPNSRPIAIGNVEDIQPGVLMTVTGWGHLEYKRSRMQDLLRRVNVPILSRETCLNLPLSTYKNITQTMFCAGYLNGTKDSCQGDSGGPGAVRGKLLGLVSFGVGCALRDQPGVYSNVPLVRDWIRSVTSLPL